MSDMVHADEKALQQAALDRLKLIGAVTRYQADAIRFAVEVGIPKQRIHELTGRSRSAIDQTLAREALRPQPPCDYCLHEHFQAARRGKDIPPLRDASGYLIYRIGDRPEIVAQRLCTEHLTQDWENRLPTSARRILAPHMPEHSRRYRVFTRRPARRHASVSRLLRKRRLRRVEADPQTT